ncbi:unnamed protein product [Ixodes pacificus]
MEGTLVELRKNWFCLLLFLVAVNTHFFRVATFSCDSFAPRCVMRRRFANTKMDIEYFSIVILHSLAAFDLLILLHRCRKVYGIRLPVCVFRYDQKYTALHFSAPVQEV